MKQLIEVLEIVKRLNQQIQETYSGGMTPVVELVTDGVDYKVSFFGGAVFESFEYSGEQLLAVEIEKIIVEAVNSDIAGMKAFENLTMGAGV